jgi:predicted DNA-binding transcriptional regulator YafY
MKQKNTSTRLQRLDELTGLLKSNDHNLIADLAENLGVSPRTVMRDLELLREKGYPIETSLGRGGGVSLHKHWGLGRLHFNYKEIIDLLLSLAVMEKLHSPIFLSNLKSIRHKIAASFPEAQRKQVQAVRKRILLSEIASETSFTPLGQNNNAAVKSSANSVYEAFFEMKAIRINYSDVKGSKTERTIEPHFILLCWPVWYILAWDHLRDDARCFRLDRIQKAKLENQTFKLKSSQTLIGKLENFTVRL